MMRMSEGVKLGSIIDKLGREGVGEEGDGGMGSCHCHASIPYLRFVICEFKLV